MRSAYFLAGLALLTCDMTGAAWAQATPAEAAATIKRINGSQGFRKAVAALEQGHDEWVANIITLTEIPAPPFKEAARAKAYADMFRSRGLTNVEIDEVGISRRQGPHKVAHRLITNSRPRSVSSAMGLRQVVRPTTRRARAVVGADLQANIAARRFDKGLMGAHTAARDCERIQ